MHSLSTTPGAWRAGSCLGRHVCPAWCASCHCPSARTQRCTPCGRPRRSASVHRFKNGLRAKMDHMQG
eukprot:1136393-Pelagomonas_calceolata.AAC.3